MKEEATYKKNKEVSEIRIILSRYEDIFSEFDPRSLSERGMAGNFLFEAERAVISKSIVRIDFIMHVPKENIEIKKERIIIERLSDYFKRHYNIMKKEKKNIIKKGIIFSAGGVILMLIATILFFKFQDESLLIRFLTILFEPGGWFLFWQGLDLIIFKSNEKTTKLEFYKRMSESNIKFDSS